MAIGGALVGIFASLLTRQRRVAPPREAWDNATPELPEDSNRLENQ
jgi:hypothetical protein